MDRLPTDLIAELADVRARLATLEAERANARRRVRRVTGLAVLAALVGTAASAASGACPNGMPFCFNPDEPALASQVNMNFAQLKEWLESKVGTVGTGVKITTGATVSPTVPSLAPPAQATRALFVSAPTTGGGEPIADFRHDNQTQGIGIGWNSIVATGSSTNQDIQLFAKGNGQIVANSNLVVASNSNLQVGASTTICATSPCYCPSGSYLLSWTGTCSGAGVAVYSVAPVSSGSQRGIDVQCINYNFTLFAGMKSMTVTCSRLVTQ